MVNIWKKFDAECRGFRMHRQFNTVQSYEASRDVMFIDGWQLFTLLYNGKINLKLNRLRYTDDDCSCDKSYFTSPRSPGANRKCCQTLHLQVVQLRSLTSVQVNPDDLGMETCRWPLCSRGDGSRYWAS